MARPRAGLSLAVAAALGLAIAVWNTGFHVVPSTRGLWRGVTDPPGAVRVALSLTAGILIAALLSRRPASVRRPLLVLALAAAPFIPVATAALLPLLSFQGRALVLVAAAALAAAMAREGMLSRSRREPSRPPWRFPPPLLLFGAAFLFYVLLGTRIPGPAGPQGDEPHYLVMAESLLSDGDLDLADEFRDRAYAPFFAGTLQPHTSPASPPGALYPVHAPGLPALLLPAYAIGGYAGARLFISLLAAVAGVFVFQLVRAVYGSDAVALAAWGAFTFTPPLPFYAVSIYPETLAALATVAFLLLARPRRSSEVTRDSAEAAPGAALWAALLAALLPWLHPKLLPLAALGLGLTLFRRHSWWIRSAAVIVFASALGALLLFLGHVYGRASLSAAYGPGFESDVSPSRLPWGAAALLLDRQFGLLFIAPLWALALPGWIRLLRFRPGDGLRAALLGAATFLVGASFSMWWGGSCPPARFMVPALPALALAIGPALRERPALSAALGGAGLAVVALAAEAPRALHNRADGESALLRFLVPSLDLDSSLPSFVLGGTAAPLLALTLTAVLALAWLRGRSGFLPSALGYLVLSSTLREAPLIDERRSELRLLSEWDGDNVIGRPAPLDLKTLSIPVDLPRSPWTLEPLEVRNSRRLDLPPGLYRVDARGRIQEALPTAHVVRLDVTAGDLLLAQAYLREGRPPPSFPLLLPVGARRLMITAAGIQGKAVLTDVRLAPLDVVPRELRALLPWPRVPQDERYRVGRGEVRTTALDWSAPEGEGFRLEGEEGLFVVEAPAGSEVAIEITRPRPKADDALSWGQLKMRLSRTPQVALSLPVKAGILLGETGVVPIRVRSYGSWIRFSGSPGGASVTESSSASPAALPNVTTMSGPPDSGK